MTPEKREKINQQKKVWADIVTQWKERYPVFKKCLPLKMGIDRDILERHPDINAVLVKKALQFHVSNFKYLSSVCKQTHRFDLDEQPTAEISEEEKQHSRDFLKKLMELRKGTRQTPVEPEDCDASKIQTDGGVVFIPESGGGI